MCVVYRLCDCRPTEHKLAKITTNGHTERVICVCTGIVAGIRPGPRLDQSHYAYRGLNYVIVNTCFPHIEILDKKTVILLDLVIKTNILGR